MATPSPSPLTPTPPATQVIGNFEKVASPNGQTNEFVPFNYMGMFNQQQSPVKLTPLNEDLGLEFDGVTTLRNNESTRHFVKTSESNGGYY